MDFIEVEKLIQPVSEERPCGEDLEYELAFIELEHTARGTPEREMGASLVPAESADWHQVREQAVGLFDQTKDLRVTIYLTHALLQTEGLPGFATGIQLLRRLLETFWDNIYPQLDADDNNDPTLRLNCLMALGDPHSLLHDLQQTPLVASRAMGRFSLRDIRLANGAGTTAEDETENVTNEAQITAAFLDAGDEQLAPLIQAAEQSLQDLNALLSFIDQQPVDACSLDLSGLTQALSAIVQIYHKYAQQQDSGGIEMTTQPVSTAPLAESTTTDSNFQTPVTASNGSVTSREDVITMIDKICDYYQTNEPSSPVPVLMKRAQRLVNSSFMEIMRDLAPDGLSQAEKLRGSEAENRDS